MDYGDFALLGIIQGLTEFLPVSSSGHLVIFQNFMGFHEATENVTFDIFLHLATLLAVVFVYRRDLWNILAGKTVGEGEEPIPKWRFILFIAISILVTGIAYPFKDSLETLFENVNGVRIFLLINAVALAVLPLMRRGTMGLGRMTWMHAAAIGLAQAFGVFPGISRSGSTILAGLLLGLSPREACRYSFLLSIPTILIAAVVQVPDVMDAGITFAAGPMITGFVLALAAGLVAIPLLVGVVEKGKLWGFSIYCALVGAGLFFITPEMFG